MQIRKKTIVCMLLFILFVGNAVAQNLITNVYGRDIRSLNERMAKGHLRKFCNSLKVFLDFI